MHQVQQTANGVYLTYIDDYLREIGADSAAIFQQAGFSYPEFIQVGERVSMTQLGDLITAIDHRNKYPNFFLDLGARIPVIAHGQLGSAILACKDVLTLLTLVARYAAIVLPFVKISLNQQEEDVVVEYQVLTPSSELNEAIIEAVFGHSSHNLSLIAGMDIFPKKASVIYKEPANAASYQKFTHCTVEFNKPINSTVFSKRSLQCPIRTANAVGERMLVNQCEDELKKIQSNTPLVDRVREILSLYLEESPSIESVAEKLKVSERTLRRRLNEEGLNFRDLLKEIRLQTAKYYLEKTDIRIEKIAWQLGYKETSNFRKAFKDLTGLSPREWRNDLKGN